MSDEKLRLELTMRQSARDALGMIEGDYWPSDVAAAQARDLLASDWLRDHDAALVAKARAEALREAASNLPTERHRGKRNDHATIASVARYLDGLAEGRARR